MDSVHKKLESEKDKMFKNIVDIHKDFHTHLLQY